MITPSQAAFNAIMRARKAHATDFDVIYGQAMDDVHGLLDHWKEYASDSDAALLTLATIMATPEETE